jgi:hypothetical protein
LNFTIHTAESHSEIWGSGELGVRFTLHAKNTGLKCLFNPGLGKRERERERERQKEAHTHSAPNWTHLQFKYLLPCVGTAKLWSFPSLQYGAHTRTRTHLHVDTNDHTCIWDRKGLHNTAHFE